MSEMIKITKNDCELNAFLVRAKYGAESVYLSAYTVWSSVVMQLGESCMCSWWFACFFAFMG